MAAASSCDSTIQIVPVPKRKRGDGAKVALGHTLCGHRGQVPSLDFSHGGELLASAGDDRVVKLWRWRKQTTLFAEVDSKGGCGTAMDKISSYGSQRPGKGRDSIFPDSIVRSQFFYLDQFLLTASSNKVFLHRLGDDGLHQLSKALSLSGCQRVTALSAANSFYSHLVLCACSDRTLRVLDLGQEGTGTAILPGLHRSPATIVIQPTSASDPRLCDLVATAAPGDGTKLWDLRLGGDSVQRLDCPGDSASSSGGADFSPCAKFLALGSSDGSCYLYDLRRCGGYLKRLTPQRSSGNITDVSYGACGNYLTCGTQDGKILFFCGT